MRIPSDAFLARKKLTGYLLVPRTRSDKSKFLAQAGFTLEDPDILEQAIRQLVAANDAVEDRQDEYGTFFRVEGTLVGPDGELAVVTVWLLPSVEQRFHFVTLKPKRG